MQEQIKEYGFPAVFLIMSTKFVFDLIGTLIHKIKDKETKEEKETESLKDYRIEAAIGRLTENMIRQTTILENMQREAIEIGQGINRIEKKFNILRGSKQDHA